MSVRDAVGYVISERVSVSAATRRTQRGFCCEATVSDDSSAKCVKNHQYVHHCWDVDRHAAHVSFSLRCEHFIVQYN